MSKVQLYMYIGEKNLNSYETMLYVDSICANSVYNTVFQPAIRIILFVSHTKLKRFEHTAED